MIKYMIGIFVLFAQVASAQNISSVDENSGTVTLQIKPTIGYSISKTSFNIAGNESGQNPNVLSELIWDPTNAIEYGADARLMYNRLVLRADFLLSKTVFGDVSDIDYDGDNRTLPYSKLYLSNHKGTGYSLKFQPGYEWSNRNDISLITFLSVDYISRRLYLLNDKDWQSNNSNYISGLNSYYKYKFPNYGLGMQLDFTFHENWSANVGLEGYLSKYYAYGNWNLIEDFEKPISYEHKGNGKRINTSLGVAYNLSANTKIGLDYQLNHFDVQNGKDYLYTKSDGLLRSRLNDANETKHMLLLHLNFGIPLGK